jgi:multicomponent Na+:H+ antiporter subunit E
MREVFSRILLFLAAYIMWLLLNWLPDWQHAVIGIPIALIVSYLTGDMFAQRPHHFKEIRRYIWFLYYVPIFLWECFKANIDVAYRVSHPDIPIRPGIVKVKTALKSDTGLTFLANSITLTPGTLSVDVDEKKGYLYVHWIDVKEKDVEGATKRIAERFERILGRIFE